MAKRIPIEAFGPKLTIDEALDEIAIVVHWLSDEQEAVIRSVLERLR